MRRLVNHKPGRGAAVLLAVLPFLLLLGAYFLASSARLASDPHDKLMPAYARLGSSFWRMATHVDIASGHRLLWWDSELSLLRLFEGLGLSAAIALLGGIAIGFIPYLQAAFSPFLAFLSLIPPLSILPILFILFGLGEISKIALMVLGLAPFLVRDVAMRVAEIPREQIIKAQTLGASSWLMITGIVLPQILPRLVDSVRLSLGSGWLYLISAEAIASQGGLGYRIFLVRRYLAMDVILPYVAWITLLAFLMDVGLRQLSAWLFPWDRLRDQ